MTRPAGPNAPVARLEGHRPGELRSQGWAADTDIQNFAPPHPQSLPIEGREAQIEMPVFIVSLPLVGRDQGWGAQYNPCPRTRTALSQAPTPDRIAPCPPKSP